MEDTLGCSQSEGSSLAPSIKGDALPTISERVEDMEVST